MTFEDKPKRRRIMIISGDESIIDEIKNSKNAALCKSLILESQEDDMDIMHSQVDFSFQKNHTSIIHILVRTVNIKHKKIEKWHVNMCHLWSTGVRLQFRCNIL